MLEDAVLSANVLDDHVSREDGSSDLVVDLQSPDVLFVKKKKFVERMAEQYMTY